MNKEELIKQAKIEKCRRNFWYFCKTMIPGLYTDENWHLKELCDELQQFYYSDTEFLSINLPPRHGKSKTATLFTDWIFGINNKEKIMTASYNQDIAKEFSKEVRDRVIQEPGEGTRITYGDIFPGTKLKFGSATAEKWSLEGSTGASYLATSPSGSATGFGCTIMILDDIIKSALVAHNKRELESHWSWFTDTMLSRREGKKKVIFIMTRWSSKDLTGRAIAKFSELGVDMKVIEKKLIQDDGSLLCPAIFSEKDYRLAKETMSEDIFEANYNQKLIDKKGCLYTTFLTYDNLPEKIESIDNYTDTADTGSDYLCSITYAASGNKYYILDIIYTQEPMEVTEELVAKALAKYKVNKFHIESNNGGRGFGRNVMRITKELGNYHTQSKPFTQRLNKESRILTGSTAVMNCIHYPNQWKKLFPKFYQDVTEYQRVGKNDHDDAVDALTGIIEKGEKKKQWGW